MSKLRSIFENNQHSILLGSLLVLLFGHLIVPKMLLADFVPVFLMQVQKIGVVVSKGHEQVLGKLKAIHCILSSDNRHNLNSLIKYAIVDAV
jgi:hypothetical protein